MYTSSFTRPPYYKEDFSSLPTVMKIAICTFLEPNSLKIISKTSKEMFKIIESNIFFQNKILCDFALKVALRIQCSISKRAALVKTAKEQSLSGDKDGAEKTRDLIKLASIPHVMNNIPSEHEYQKIRIMASDLAGSDREGEALGLALMVKDLELRNRVLQDIAIKRLERMHAAEVDTMNLLVESTSELQELFNQQINDNQMVEAKETIANMRKTKHFCAAISSVLVLSNRVRNGGLLPKIDEI